MKTVIKIFVLLSLLSLSACGSKETVLASSEGVEIKSSVVAKIFNEMPEQNRKELQGNKEALLNFTKNTAAQLASIEIIALRAKDAGVQESKDYLQKVKLGQQELLIRLFVNQEFTAKEEDLTDEQLRAEYDKIKSSLSEQELENLPEYEAVKAKIKQQLVSQKAQEQFQSFIAPLAEKVELKPENIQKVADDFYDEKPLDEKIVLSKVGESVATLQDLIISLGDLSLQDVRKQVKAKEEVEQFFRKSAENLGINIQIEQKAKDEGIEGSKQYLDELKEIKKILLVNIFLKKELFADINIQDDAVKAEYEKIKANNKDIAPLDEIFQRVKAQLIAKEQEVLVMDYLESLKKDISLYEASIDEFVYDLLDDDAQDKWDQEKQEETQEKDADSIAS